MNFLKTTWSLLWRLFVCLIPVWAIVVIMGFMQMPRDIDIVVSALLGLLAGVVAEEWAERDRR